MSNESAERMNVEITLTQKEVTFQTHNVTTLQAESPVLRLLLRHAVQCAKPPDQVAKNKIGCDFCPAGK